MLSYTSVFSKKAFAIESNLKFISRTNFMLDCVEHETNIAPGLGYRLYNLISVCLIGHFVAYIVCVVAHIVYSTLLLCP